MLGNSWLAGQLFACQVLCHMDLVSPTELIVDTPFNVVEVLKGSSERIVKQEIAM